MTTDTLDRLTDSGIRLLQDEVRELRAAVDQASRDPNWQVGTRFGLERRYKKSTVYTGGIAFIDIDQMKQLNSRMAYKSTNNMLRCAFDLSRANDFLFRYQEGDELVAMVPMEDMPGLLTRLKQAFELLGLSFTACYAVCTSAPYPCMAQLATAVVLGKETGRRGDVWELEHNQ